VIWSVVFIALLLTAVRGWRRLRGLVRQPRTLLVVLVAAVLIAVNWGTYIYAVNTDRVVEASLGYFMTPLLSVAFGLVFFGERLRPAQWSALAVGVAAVIVLTVDYGRPPWIALTLAGSFSSYSLVKKRLALPPADGLLAESVALALPGLVYLGWLAAQSRSSFPGTPGHAVLLVLSGAVTAVPLLLFASAANRIPLTALGILQYVTPTLQFGIGVLVEHEPMPPARLFGFALVWLALMVFTWDGLRHSRRATRTAQSAAVT